MQQIEHMTRTRWGRIRFGSRRLGTLWIAVPLGILLAAGIGALSIATGIAGPRPLLGGLVFALVALWACILSVWALVVDRSTLRGADDRPEESIEASWYSAASSGAFTDVLLVVGVAATVIALTGIELPTAIVLATVILLAMVSFGARYLLLHRRG